MFNEKVRIYALAAHLNVDSKDLLDLCRQRGLAVKNQLSLITSAEAAEITKLLRDKPAQLNSQAQPSSVAIRPQREYRPAFNSGIEQLLSVGEMAGFVKLNRIPLVAEIDPESAIFLIRKLTERLCRLILKVTTFDTLNDAIIEIGKQKMLSRKVLAYLDQIRKVGNVAVHDSDDLFEEQFSIRDVNIASEALACVIEESISRNLVNTKR